MRPSFKSLAALSLAALLTSCASAPLKAGQGLIAAPAAFSGATPASPPTAMPHRGAWWLVFADPVLDDLMARAMDKNNDIRLSYARLDQAKALLKSSKADLWPQAGLSYAPNRATVPGAFPKAQTAHSLDVDLSYEIDIFGRLGKAAKASRFEAQSSAALLKDTQLLIQSRVAQSYFALRALDEERTIVSETLEAYRGSLKVTQRRFEEGDVAELDVARLQTAVASTEAEGLNLDQQRAQLAHALAVLVGEVPTDFEVARGQWASQPWADHVPVIPAAIPSTVLAQRPDVLAAQFSFEASKKRLGYAKAAWFPNFRISASGGYVATDVDNLFEEAAKTFNVTGLITQAVFDGGKRNAGINYAKGDMGAALALYRQQILVALQDVEDQLSDLSLLEAQSRAQDQAVEAANRSLAMSQSRYRNGSSSQLELLDAQRQQLAIRRQALKVRAARYLSSVGLIRALGGVW